MLVNLRERDSALGVGESWCKFPVPAGYDVSPEHTSMSHLPSNNFAPSDFTKGVLLRIDPGNFTSVRPFYNSTWRTQVARAFSVAELLNPILEIQIGPADLIRPLIHVVSFLNCSLRRIKSWLEVSWGIISCSGLMIYASPAGERWSSRRCSSPSPILALN